MKLLFKLIFNKAYYLGFILAGYFAWGSFTTSDDHVGSLRNIFASESKINNIMQTNSVVQRTMAISSTAIAINNIKLYDQGYADFKKQLVQFEEKSPLTGADYDQSLENLKNINIYMAELQLYLQKSVAPRAQQMSQLIELMEKTRKQLDGILKAEWKIYVANQSSVIEWHQSNAWFQRMGQFALSAFLFILMFMSSRKERAEKMVRASENLHRMMFSSLSEGVLLCMPNGRVVAANGSAGKILGHKSESMKNHKLQELLPMTISEKGDELKSRENPISKILRSTMPIRNVVLGIFKPNGQVRWLSMSSQPVLDTDFEGAQSTVISFSDITAKVRARETIEKQQSLIINSAKMAELGEMAGGIAHEINNPLTIIQAEADILQDIAEEEEVLDPNLAIKASERITKTVMRIAKIVKGMRTFARDGSTDPVEETSVKELVDESVEMSRGKYMQSFVDLIPDEVPEDLIIECRAVQVSQVLINLLSNARDAVDSLEEKWVKIEVVDRGADVEISVTDSGNGIPKAVRDKIFQPFFTTKDVGAGTGLGMSISLGIIENHNGQIYIDEDCKKTRFVIVLPKKQPLEGILSEVNDGSADMPAPPMKKSS